MYLLNINYTFCLDCAGTHRVVDNLLLTYAMIQEILTCQDPFQEIQGTEIMYTVTVKKKIPRRPEHLAEKTPRNELFWSAMCQCWVHEPNRRATAQEIADLLNSASEIQNGKGAKKPSSLCCTVA